MISKISTLILVLFMFVAGSGNESNDILGQSVVDNNSYHTSVFVKDDRLQRIKDAAPAIKLIFEKFAITNKIPGIAYGIVIDDSLVIGSAMGLINLDNKLPATTNSCFRIASMTKSFTAMAILKLRDEGKLNLHDLVSDYIPEMANLKYITSDAPAINIQHLLTMTSGLPEDNAWGDRLLDETEQMVIDMFVQGVSFSNIPAFEYEYSNTGYALLGIIISHVSGMPYQDYISENILQPLGMEHTYWEYSDIDEAQLAHGYRWEDEQWKAEPMLHDGSFGAMGGLITTIKDFGKYVSYHLSAWPPRNGEETGPVKRSTLREMHTPQFPRLKAESTNWNGDTCATMSGYGYGLSIIRDCRGITLVRHGGALPGFGSNYIFYPEYGVGIMAFGNLTYTFPLPEKEFRTFLFETVGLQPRQLPVSDILLQRQEQVVQLIQSWDSGMETEILAENFYLDIPRKLRIASIKDMFDKAGTIIKINAIEPTNQLRGDIKIQAENGIVNVFFTLSPEKNPKVQEMEVSFKPNESK
ncbi:MAG: serine hydrolase [Melioribacteraceae bacterium]|jgi:CubicO group peptidase (beta-lactamase class C family)|nr:serine hydrolase [Melioribacteraceae bacterium]